MTCPECGAELGIGEHVEFDLIGWVCSKCNIKIYKRVNVKT